ncbi:MAG: DUF5615 family PIN-like protein [Planctomycetota bacterium]|nr:DUF5615 family PIN-like protein [Planctomycetota bacterium]
MIRFLFDENVSRMIFNALLKRNSSLDLVRVQERGLMGHGDDELLEWAARENRVLVTHDRQTMLDSAYKRVVAGLPMPGMVVIPGHIQVRQALEDLQTIAECALAEDLDGQAIYLPL